MSESRPIQTPTGVVNVEPLTPLATTPAARVTPARSGPSIVRLRNLDTWSVMKTAFVLSIALAIVVVTCVFVLWGLLTVTGVFDTIGRQLDDIAGSSANLSQWFAFERVALLTVLLAAVEVVLTTAALTLLAALYNIAASWGGGIEATLADDRS